MRKILLLALVFAAITAAAWAGTITVTSPRAGDVLCQGRAYQIRWTSSGVSGRVMVRLMQGRVAAAYLSWDTENDGLFDYTVSDRLPAGDYTVAVLSRDDSSVRGESGIFRIDPCLVTAKTTLAEILPMITVTYPINPRTPFYVGGYQKIRWTARGRMPSVVNISLHPADCSGVGTYLSTANPRSGEQLVRIPTTVTSEGLHSIRVGAFPGSPYGCGQFDLRRDMIVSEPTSGSVWHPGESVIVRWRGGRRTNTHIILASEDSIRRYGTYSSYDYTLAENVWVADHARRITLPAGLAPGRYAICLAFVDSMGIGTFSDIFQVVAR